MSPGPPPLPAAQAERLLTPRFLLVVACGFAYFMALGTMVPTVPLFVKHELGGGDIAVGVAVGAFAVGAVLLRPAAGRIGDRAGRRILMIAGASMVGVSVLTYNLAMALPLLVLGRFVGGLGEAAFFVGAGTMITDLAPESRRGEAISYWSVAVYGGVGLGPTLGLLVLDETHYGRLWVATAVLAFLAAFGSLFVRETLVRAAPTIDAPAERKPLVNRQAIRPGLVLLLGGIGLVGLFQFLPLYTPEIGMDDPGLVFLVYAFGILVVRILGAKIPDRVGPQRSGSLSTIGIAIGLTIIAAIPHPAGLYAGTVVLALGMSLLFPSALTLAMTDVPEEERGSALGTVTAFFDLSQGFGAVVLGGVAALVGYRGSFFAGALFALGALALLVLGFDARMRKPVDHEAARIARESLDPEPG